MEVKRPNKCVQERDPRWRVAETIALALIRNPLIASSLMDEDAQTWEPDKAGISLESYDCPEQWYPR